MIGADGLIVYTQPTSVQEALLLLMMMYYAFDIDYPSQPPIVGIVAATLHKRRIHWQKVLKTCQDDEIS